MTTLGFVGLGHMGEPMAARLAQHDSGLVVWNRTIAKVGRLAALGAAPAASAAEVFDRCDVVVLMLANGTVIDEILGRQGHDFSVSLGGRVVVNMGTVAPEYSLRLYEDVLSRGGRYVEAPVSGSRVPAEAGQLVAMLAGDAAVVRMVEPLLAPMTAATFHCGQVPMALETKLAVNTFLISMVTGLAEAVSFAEHRGLDLTTLRAVLDAGPMSSAVSRIKLAKLVSGDLSAQASVSDVLYNNRLILAAAPTTDCMPLLAQCAELYAEAEALGLGSADMAAVIEAIRGRKDTRLAPTVPAFPVSQS